MSINLGLEIEFMVAYHASTSKYKTKADIDDLRWPENIPCKPEYNGDAFKDRFYASHCCILEVCRVLATLGLPVACKIEDDEMQTPLFQQRFGGTPKLLNQMQFLVWNDQKVRSATEIERFGYWYVTQEMYMTHDQFKYLPKGTPKAYDWYAVEINTPIISDEAELRNRLPTVKLALDTLRKHIKIWVNATCGLHLHASPQFKQLDLTTARAAVAHAVLLENSLLCKMRHPCREKSSYTLPITKSSNIARGKIIPFQDDFSRECLAAIDTVRSNRKKSKVCPLGANDNEIYSIIHSILSQRTVDSLAIGLRMQSPSLLGSTKIALDLSPFGTLEFRYPEASFNMDFINLWAEVAERIFAKSPTDVGYPASLALLYELATSKNGDRATLLKLLRLEHWVTFSDAQRKAYRGSMSNLNKQGILPPP